LVHIKSPSSDNTRASTVMALLRALNTRSGKPTHSLVPDYLVTWYFSQDYKVVLWHIPSLTS
jgi:hypothetical protein